MNLNQKVKVKNNVYSVLKGLKFNESDCKSLHDTYSNTIQNMYHFWVDADGTEYATIEMGVELPLACLEEIKYEEL